MIDPITRTITVTKAPEDAFRVFTAEMGSWWPLDVHGRAEDGQKTERLVFEEAPGGRIYEVFSDGTEGLWGTITAWEPPRRLVIDWKPNDEDRPPTEVEVTFEALETGGTRVTLEHRGWDVLGPELGARGRASYASGWPLVFDDRFAAAAG
jgi:uncharacterized protein YndB with AHSA1/START domain